MSLRQSMYTGLAQPEVKTNGRSSKNSTAFTSSSILAVVSAMNAWSAKCMSGANFNRLESAYLALRGESCDGTGANNNRCSGADHRIARCARSIDAQQAHLPLRRQGRQEILRLDGAHAVPRPADRAAQYFRHGRQAHRPGQRREKAPGETGRSEEKTPSTTRTSSATWSSPAAGSSARELAARHPVDQLGVGLALRCFHDLPHQGIEGLFLTRAVVLYLLRIRSEHIVH